MDFEKLIDRFNDGELNVEAYFGNFNNFLTLANKKGLISKFDITNEEIQNSLLIWLYNNDREKFHEFVVDELGDLEMGDDGKIYLDLSDSSELATLVCDRYRDSIDKNTVSSILSGGFDFDFIATTDDVYVDVINVLNKKNTELLKEFMVNQLRNQKIEPGTSELQEIAEEQDHPEYCTIDDLETAQRILDDEESMNFLLGHNLDYLETDLYHLHRNAYGQAYENELYDRIWDELQEYVEGRGEYYSQPHTYKKGTMSQRFKIPVSSNFDNVILNYLIDRKNDGSYGLLEYWGYYLGLVEGTQDCLRIYEPDYWGYELNEYVNDLFTDFL